MKAVVRDDIIALDSFVAAEFKYKPYLEMLMKSGNYCFLDQFKRLIDNGQAIVNGMIENNLIGMENINKNYKYIYLSDTAMKYLYLRDSEEDYSNITKNRISVKKVNKNPTEKQLLSSAYKFHLLVTGEDLIDKESIMKSLEDLIFIKRHSGNSEIYNNWFKNNQENIKNIKSEIETLKSEKDEFENNIVKFNKGLGLFDSSKEHKEYLDLDSKCRELESEIKEKSQKFLKTGFKELNLELESLKNLKDEVYKSFLIKNKAIANLNELMKDFNEKILNKENELKEIEEKFNRITKSVEEVTIPKVNEVQKVFENLYNISKVIARIKDNKLEFIILDNGNFKTAYGYLKQINSIKSLDLGIEEIKIIIYSYAEHRAYNLYNEFLKAEEVKSKAQKTIRNFNIKTENASKKPDFYIAAKKVYDNTPDFEVEMREDFFYMKKYMDFISSSTKSIKRKDKKAIDDLVERLKNNE
ncbi:hypothetical protein H9660_15145 [Clostridium sp. Sa3CUN1]|uniref:Uncharacterized protein n=1 Tax=Clostridium gallinarum TaxID=2762246 RepID=A0ABR8Q8A1_9CLOT|nr:hypothetical protein [Clostridium gallinarum]MBD7916479.1 hypothetical protein [Clostridium gallinarum]